MNRPLTSPSALLAVAGTAALLLAGCSTTDPGAPDAEPVSDASDGSGEHEHEHPDGDHTETDGAQPRLVVTTEDGALVLDAATLEEVGSVVTTSAPRAALAGDDRHVLLVQSDRDRTDVLDAGTWSSAHGDHSHHYAGPPALLDLEVTGTTPIHVVSHAGSTAVFHDGDGTAALFHDADLVEGVLDLDVVDSGAPHHGVAVPVDGGVLLSIPGSDALPVGVSLVDPEGREVARFEDCPGLHGEAATDEVVAFGCSDGVLLVEGTTATKVDYPGGGADRVGALVSAAGSPVLLGDLGDTSLTLVDTAAATMQPVDLGLTYGPRARTTDGDALVLTTDGVLHLIDVPTGEVTVEIPTVGAFELPQGHGGTTPQLAVVGHRAVISDPATSRLVVVDLEAGTVTGEVDLAEVPTGLLAVNAAS